MEVTIDVLSAQNLRPKDFIGSSDPYVLVRPGNGKTTFKTNTLNPVWDGESIRFQVSTPTIEAVIIEVWDHDYAPTDDFLGFAAIDLGAVTTTPREMILQLGPAPKAGRLQVRISASVDGPYAGMKVRPSDAPPLQVPRDYKLAGTYVVRTARQDRNASIAVHQLW